MFSCEKGVRVMLNDSDLIKELRKDIDRADDKNIELEDKVLRIEATSALLKVVLIGSLSLNALLIALKIFA